MYHLIVTTLSGSAGVTDPTIRSGSASFCFIRILLTLWVCQSILTSGGDPETTVMAAVAWACRGFSCPCGVKSFETMRWNV